MLVSSVTVSQNTMIMANQGRTCFSHRKLDRSRFDSIEEMILSEASSGDAAVVPSREIVVVGSLTCDVVVRYRASSVAGVLLDILHYVIV